MGQIVKIPRCYDSHVHLIGTGQMLSTLRLENLSSPNQIETLEITSHHYRGEWIYGFGWNDSNWSTPPSLEILDNKFKNIPVCLVRADGHAVWVNSVGLEKIKIHRFSPDPDGGRIDRDIHHHLTGVLVDGAKDLVDAVLPPYSREQIQNFAMTALRYFSEAGFSHLRDMTSNRIEFEILRELDQKKNLKQYLELNFFSKNIDDFYIQLKDLVEIHQQTKSSHIKVVGIKLFYDGALGSEGALLSHCYCNSKNSGLRLWQREQIQTVLQETWKNNLSVAIHCIGDQAADEIVDLAIKLKGLGITGVLHLEHVEILRPETLLKMAQVNPICHLQPSHWLSDHLWMEKKIGSLYQYAFPWQALENHKIDFFFGSDSPIEVPSIGATTSALKNSAQKGVAPLLGSWLTHHSHPDQNWGSECCTIYDTASGNVELTFNH